MLNSLITLAENGTQSEKVLLWTLVLSSGGSFFASIIGLVKYLVDRRGDREKQKQLDDMEIALREQDRLDAKNKAELLLLEGALRERRLSAKIDENTEVSKEAFKAANGHNEKIKAAVECVAEVAKVIAQSPPREIHVTVDQEK
jgi:hypothetical protein